MKRRTFMKVLAGLVAAGAVNPVSAVDLRPLPNAWDQFNPDHTYGRGYTVTDHIDRELLREAWDMIAPDIQYTVPPRYRGQIKFKYQNPQPNDYDPLIMRGHISWIYTPEKENLL